MANNLKSSKRVSSRNVKNNSKIKKINKSKKPKEEIEERQVNRGRIDPIIIISMIMLVSLGVIMVFSASYYFAQTKLLKPDITFFFRRQAIFVALGFVAVFFVTKLDWRIFRRFAPLVYIVSIFFQFLVIVKCEVCA